MTAPLKAEVLYVADCPSHPAAVALVKDILAANNLPAEVREILVTDEQMACALQFPGSPTIRINGRDIEASEIEIDEANCHELNARGIAPVPIGPSQNNFSLSCRWYPGTNKLALPTPELIQRAILAALGPACHPAHKMDCP
jgi:hypothetical protein